MSRKKKEKPVDIVITPDIPFYKYGSPPKCKCLGGHCWRTCQSSNKKKEEKPRRNRNKILTWHPPKEEK